MNETKSVYEWALLYIKVYSVIPVGRDKRPMVDWKEFQTRKATPEEIKVWFDKPEPPNIAIVTGKISGITVVDIEKGGKWEHYPVTQSARSGGGGYHLYYQYAPGMSNKARIHELTDIRSDGGYIIAPPSSHASGGTYEWFRKELVQPFPYQMFGETPGEYKKKDWQDILTNGANQGERNQTAAQVVGKLLKTLPFEDWMTVAWPMLVHWNASSNPPLEDRELRGVFNSIAGKEMRSHQTRQSKKESTLDEIVQHDDEVKLISSIVGDISDDLEVRYPTGFSVVDKAFRGGLKDGDMWFVTGYSGSGKTSLSQTMTYNLIMAGQPVLWFSYEVLIHEIWRKFKEMGVSNDFLAYSPAIMATGNVDWVEKKIIEARDKFKTKVIFIDHLGFLAPITDKVDSNLNSNYSIYLGMICRQLKAIAIREKVAIVLMGHLRKPTVGKGDDPTMHDIKDSAAVAQESDAVIIVNRKRQSSGGGGYDGGASDDLYSNETQVKIEKNRVTGETKVFSVEMIKGRLMDFDQRAKEEGFII